MTEFARMKSAVASALAEHNGALESSRATLYEELLSEAIAITRQQAPEPSGDSLRRFANAALETYLFLVKRQQGAPSTTPPDQALLNAAALAGFREIYGPPPPLNLKLLAQAISRAQECARDVDSDAAAQIAIVVYDALTDKQKRGNHD